MAGPGLTLPPEVGSRMPAPVLCRAAFLLQVPPVRSASPRDAPTAIPVWVAPVGAQHSVLSTNPAAGVQQALPLAPWQLHAAPGPTGARCCMLHARGPAPATVTLTPCVFSLPQVRAGAQCQP